MKILHLDENHPLIIEQLDALGFQNEEDYTSSKEEILKKIYHVAVALEARLQGDEGEIYDEYGESNWQELKEQGDAMTKELTKKWWPFWK